MGLKTWLWGIAIRKGLKKVPAAIAGLVVGYLSKDATAAQLAEFGFSVNAPAAHMAIASAVQTGIEILRNRLKHKFEALSWL